MKNFGLFILLSILLICCSPEKKAETDPFINSTTEFKKLFVDPPSEYRSAPLWDWNEQISKEGIDFQMKELKKAGIGGVFVHPRPGLLTEYLSEDWHTVEVAGGGEEALEKFRAGSFDLVITDRAMPGISGEELAAGIKALAPETRVILLTVLWTLI